MSFSLYDATIPTFRQILGSMSGLLDKAETFAATSSLGERDILDARLAPDMLPFAYQVRATSVHSIGAIEGARQGQFSPNRTPPPEGFGLLKQQINQTLEALNALSPEDVNGLIGQEMVFVFGEHRLEFTSADSFLMSFSLPNFLFHAATAYDILRQKGLEIGKRDFLGRLALKS